MLTRDVLGRRSAWLRAVDLRYGLRLLARSPLFTATAVLSLAVGIGATTVIFALADGLLVQASPGVREPGRIVDIERTTNGRGYGTISHPAYRHLREHSRTLDAIAAVSSEPVAVSLTIDESSVRVYAARVSADYSKVLQVRMARGRFFTAAEDDHRGPRRVVVLSHRLWRERFGSDPEVFTRSVRLNNLDFDVVGVAEAGFEGHTIAGADLWVPITVMPSGGRAADAAAALTDAAYTWHRAIGRLAPGVTRPAAQAEIAALFSAFKASRREVPGSHSLALEPGGRLPPPARTPFGLFIAVLFALTTGLLVVACSNVAGVMLARATARQREMATRLALGASRAQLIAQMLAESLLLFLAGALAAVPVMLWFAAALRSLLPALPIPVSFDLTIGFRTVLFAGGTTFVTALAFGLAPARQAMRPEIAGLLQGASATPGRTRLRFRQTLVVIQVTLSLATAISAGFFVRSLDAASHVDVGFRTNDVLVVSLDTELAGAQGARAIVLVDEVVQRVRAIPGVEAVGHARLVPLQGGGFHVGGLRVPGVSEDAADRLADANWDVVSPDYFRAIGLPIVAGRSFSEDDRNGATLVAIVNETFARAAWPGEAAVGKRILQTLGRDEAGRPLEIVGVAKDSRYKSVAEPPRPFIYVPFAQQPQARVELFVKHAPGREVATDVGEAVRSVEPTLPVILVQRFDEAATMGLLPQRIAAALGGTLGAIGVLLAGLGVYGLAAFVVAQRTREIAIRLALGATRGDIRSMVLNEAWRLALFAVPAGSLLAWILARVVQNLNLLVGVTATDVKSFAVPAASMALVLLVASWWPARRAAATDPAGALRAQ